MELTTLSQVLVSLLGIPLLYLLWSKAAKCPSGAPAAAAAPPPPPGPTPFPVIGNIPDLLRGGELHRPLPASAASPRPLLSLRLGMATTVVLSSPDAAHEALHKKDGAISSRWMPDNAKLLGYQDISMVWLPSSSPLWKHMRTLAITLLFTSRRLGASRGARERRARELGAPLGARSGRPVRVGLAVFGSVLNFMSNVFFSESEDVVELGSETGQAFQQLIADSVAETTKPNISDFFPFLSALDLSGSAAADARRPGTSRGTTISSTMSFDRRLNSGEKPGDLLDSLLELHAKSQLELPLIRATDLFIAGSHTTMTTVEWAMAELLRNPGKMAKARAELKEAFGQGAVEEGVEKGGKSTKASEMNEGGKKLSMKKQWRKLDGLWPHYSVSSIELIAVWKRRWVISV
uniref:Cytochrome P450 n=1 Tax=Oryza brachyantha TaxID=4533 RepID=J3MXZ1_ORYBR